MKLPKCPHCDKLLVPIITHGILIGEDPPMDHQGVDYLCPETMKRQDPEWVEVLEVQ